MIAHAQPLATPGHTVHAHSSLKTDCCRSLLSSLVVFSCSSRSLLSFSVSLAMSKRSSRSASVPLALPDSEHPSSPVRAPHGGLVPPLRPVPSHPLLVNLSSSVVSDPGVPSCIPRSVASSSRDRVPTPMPAPKRSLSFWEDGMGSQPLTKHPRPAPVTQPSLDSILQSIRDTVQTEVTAALDARFLLNSPHPISAGTCTCTVVITFLYMPVCACACVTTVG